MTNQSRLLFVAAILASLASPAFAAPNNGAFQKSAEGNKKPLNIVCAQLKKDLADQEQIAHKLGGTPDAEVFSDAADAIWESAVKAGCSWTK